MANKLFVGGLPWSATEDVLKTFFAQAGTVISANVIIDRFTGKSKGFGFVEMSTDAEAAEAVKKLNGAEMDGRKLIVNEARPKTESSGPGFDRSNRSGPRSGGSRDGFHSGNRNRRFN